MAIVILVCSMGGLSLALGLSWAYADLDRDVEAYGAQSALLRDLSRLEEDLAQWAVTSDLVYGSGDTYLIDGAIRRGDAIQRTIMRIHADEVASAFFPTLDRIEYLVEANVDRLRSIVEIDPVERGDQLQQRLMDWDEESRAVFNDTDSPRRQRASPGIASGPNCARARQAAVSGDARGGRVGAGGGGVRVPGPASET